MKMARWFGLILGLVLLLLGVVALVSPIPIGIFFIGAGLALLICVSPMARKKLQQIRTRHHGVNRRIMQLETKIENRLRVFANVLISTRPLNSQSDDNFLG